MLTVLAVLAALIVIANIPAFASGPDDLSGFADFLKKAINDYSRTGGSRTADASMPGVDDDNIEEAAENVERLQRAYSTLRKELDLATSARSLFIKKQDDQFKARQKNLIKEQQTLDVLRQEISGLERKAELTDEEARRIEVGKDEIANQEKVVALREKDNRELEEKIDRLKDIHSAQGAIADRTKNQLTALTGISDQWRKSYFGTFIRAARGPGGLAEAFKRAALAGKDLFTASNMLGTITETVYRKTLDLAFAQDSSLAAFRRSTTTFGEYNELIIKTQRNNFEFGVSTEDSARAVKDLRAEMTEFAFMTKAEKEALTDTTVALDKFGVSAQKVAAIQEAGMRVFQLGSREALEMTMRMTGLATSLNMSVTELTDSFHNLTPQLAKFGRDAEDVFRRTSASARSLGISAADVFSTFSQYDTFEGAAKAAGGLNAILGGNLLNSTRLLMADEEERLRMIREAIVASGQQNRLNDKFFVQAIAQQAGIKDVALAQKMLTGEIDRYGDALNSIGLTTDEVKARDKSFLDIKMKLAHAMQMFAISMYPVVEWLTKTIDHVTALNREMDGKLIPNVMIALVALKGFGMLMGYINMINALNLAMKGLGSSMGVVGLAAGAAVAGFMLFKDLHPIIGLLVGLTLLIGGLMVALTSGAAAPLIVAGWAAVGLGAGALAASAYGVFGKTSPVKAGTGGISSGMLASQVSSTTAAHSAANTQTGGGPTQVILKMNEREFATGTTEALNNNSNLSLRGAGAY